MFTEDDVSTEKDSCRLPNCQCDIATDEVAYKGAADTDVMLRHDQCTPVNGSIRGKWIHRQVPGFITRTLFSWWQRFTNLPPNDDGCPSHCNRLLDVNKCREEIVVTFPGVHVNFTVGVCVSFYLFHFPQCLDVYFVSLLCLVKGTVIKLIAV